jgi:hypothetical protein
VTGARLVLATSFNAGAKGGRLTSGDSIIGDAAEWEGDGASSVGKAFVFAIDMENLLPSNH